MNETMTEIIKAVFIASLPYLMPQLFILIGKSKAYFDAHTTNANWKALGDKAFLYVGAVEQTLEPKVKAAVAGGTMTLSAGQAMLKETVMVELRKEFSLTFTESAMSAAVESAVLQIGIQKDTNGIVSQPLGR